MCTGATDKSYENDRPHKGMWGDIWREVFCEYPVDIRTLVGNGDTFVTYHLGKNGKPPTSVGSASAEHIVGKEDKNIAWGSADLREIKSKNIMHM